MKVERQSIISGKINSMELPVTEEQLKEYHSRNRRTIAEIFENLTPRQREFIVTGVTDQEWDDYFNGQEDSL